MSKILLTGANGFLGTNVLNELLSRGYLVRGFILPGTNKNFIQKPGVEIFEGNLLNQDDVNKAVLGCDAVIHTAACTDVIPDRAKYIWDINLKPTQFLAEAVEKNGLKRMVHVGTANTFGYGSIKQPGNEKSKSNCHMYGLDYMDSKVAAQEYLLKSVSEKKLDAVIVNPTYMIGPFDSKPSSGQMLIALYKNQIPGYSTGGKNFVYVKDAAVGVVNALEKGKAGQCYILGHQNLSDKQFFDKAAKVMEVKSPSIGMPSFITLAFGKLNDIYARISGKRPLVTFKMARVACHGHYFDNSKAVAEIDLPQTPIETAVESAFNWFIENGYLEKK